MKQIKMTEDEFYEKYKPIKNHLDDNASWGDGNGFKTFDEELDYVLEVREKEPNKVWTILECDGYSVISSGYHHVNRQAYLITEVPCEDDVEIEAVDPYDKLKGVIETAQTAFWDAVAESYPEIESGDFTPLDTVIFNTACEDAIEAWVSGNRKEVEL